MDFLINEQQLIFLIENNDKIIDEIILGVINDIKLILPNVLLKYQISPDNKTVNLTFDVSDNNLNAKLFDRTSEKVSNLLFPFTKYGKSSPKFDWTLEPSEEWHNKLNSTPYMEKIKTEAQDVGFNDYKKWWTNFNGTTNPTLEREIKRRKQLKDSDIENKIKDYLQSKTDVPLKVDVNIQAEYYTISVDIYPQLSLDDFMSCKYKKWFLDNTKDFNFDLGKHIGIYPDSFNRDVNIKYEIIWPRDIGNYIVTQNQKVRTQLSKTLQQKVSIKIDYKTCGSDPYITISWPSNYDIDKKNYKLQISKILNKEFPYSRPIDTSNDYWGTFNSYSPEDKRYWSKQQMFDLFRQTSENLFGDIYDYDINKFTDLYSLTEVFCKQHQRWFEVLPKEHMGGKRCPFDNESKGETMVRVYLEKNNIPFKQFHKLKGCFSEINGRCILLTFDFYLPEQNAVIEYDGEQHYKPVERFGGEPTYQRQIILDNIKNVFCSKSGIKMIRIPYTVKKPKDIKELLDTQLK
jgi:hypothetical protein